MKKRYRKNGWAHTKNYPHKRHPAYYRKVKDNLVEYVTFTHSLFVDLDKNNKNIPKEEHRIIHCIRLNDNINGYNKDNDYSYVLFRVFVGNRSGLGKETKEFHLSVVDMKIINFVFNTANRYYINKKSSKEHSSENDVGIREN